MTTWVTLTRRTNDPKLAWLERRLTLAGIDSRRQGESFHAPILQVPEADEDLAWDILDPVDGVADDDPRFTEGHRSPVATSPREQMLIDALALIRNARDHYAAHGHYQPDAGPDGDQQFDDWAADLVDTCFQALPRFEASR